MSLKKKVIIIIIMVEKNEEYNTIIDKEWENYEIIFKKLSINKTEYKEEKKIPRDFVVLELTD